MTYNIEYGRRWPQVRRVVQAQDADVICLQEVPAELSSRISTELEMPHEFQLLRPGHPCRLGNMTLARTQINHGEILHTAFRVYGFTSSVTVGSIELTVANLHLSPLAGSPLWAFPGAEVLHLTEVIELAQRLGRHRGPAVAAGDFNTFWPAPACWVMRRFWRDCRATVGGRHLGTRPTYGLPFVIDHVFVRGPVSPIGYEVLPGGGSDHRAVMATLQISRDPGKPISQ